MTIAEIVDDMRVDGSLLHEDSGRPLVTLYGDRMEAVTTEWQVAFRAEWADVLGPVISEPTTLWKRPDACRCRGLAYYTPPYMSGHPEYGRFTQCVCIYPEKLRKEMLWKGSELPADPPWFDTWNSAKNPKCNDGYTAALKWSQGRLNWVVLVGKSGVGKSHLLIAAAWESVINQEIHTRYITARKFAREARMYAIHDDPQAGYRWAMGLAQYPRLVIDDIGREHITEFSTSLLFELIDARSENKLPTLMSTNFGFDELIAKYKMHEPLVSRIYGGDVETMEGSNVRITG